MENPDTGGFYPRATIEGKRVPRASLIVKRLREGFIRRHE